VNDPISASPIHSKTKEIKQETLEAVPGDPDEEELAVVESEASIEEVEDAEEDGSTDQVVQKNRVIDPAEPVEPDRRIGALGLEIPVLGSEVITRLDPVAPPHVGLTAQMFNDGDIPKTTDNGSEGETKR